jgi:hypothetical protein
MAICKFDMAVPPAATGRQRHATAKDQEEIMQKRLEYQDFTDLRDRGIVHDLEVHFSIANPTLPLLLTIAKTMSSLTGIQIGRQEKRRRDLLIGWFNKNYNTIKTYIPQMVIKDESGEMKGPSLEKWDEFREANPNAEILDFLRCPKE